MTESFPVLPPRFIRSLARGKSVPPNKRSDTPPLSMEQSIEVIMDHLATTKSHYTNPPDKTLLEELHEQLDVQAKHSNGIVADGIKNSSVRYAIRRVLEQRKENGSEYLYDPAKEDPEDYYRPIAAELAFQYLQGTLNPPLIPEFLDNDKSQKNASRAIEGMMKTAGGTYPIGISGTELVSTLMRPDSALLGKLRATIKDRIQCDGTSRQRS